MWQLAAIMIAALIAVSAWPVLVVAQTASIETGKNYDAEDIGNNQTRWTSHPERIQVNNQWQNYKLTESASSIKFESQAIGSLQYDKASCSFAVYPAGYIADQPPLLPNVSWIARIAQNGTDVWTPLTTLNSASCQVNTSQSQDGIVVTATKQTPTLNLTHTINANVYNGIKETIKIDNNDQTLTNHKFAFTQTVQTGPTLTLGNQTYNIAQVSGAVLDRNWIENNKAKIFEVANNLSYDFDIGFDYFWALRVLNDNGIHKVALDYANVGQTAILPGQSFEVDPTLTLGESDWTNARNSVSGNGSTSCAISGSAFVTTGDPPSVYLGFTGNANGFCVLSAFEHDVSSIPSTASILDVDWSTSIQYSQNAMNCDVYPLTGGRIDAQSATSLYTDARDGSIYVSNDSFCTGGTGARTVDLGATADSDLKSDLTGDDSFGFAVSYNPWMRDGNDHNIQFNPAMTQLVVVYTEIAAPGAPTSVSGTSSINNQVAVSWSAPANNGGATITDYVIQHSTDNTNWTTFADGTSASTSATVTGLTSNTSYYFRVAAVNSVGTGSYSSSSAAVLVRPSTPEAPTGLTATVVSTSQIDLAWSQPADNGGATITDYIIQYSTDNITYSTVTDGTSSALSTSVTGLSSNTLYYFKVAAVNSIGTGSYSSSTSKPTLPTAPTGLTGTTISNTSISLDWTAPSGTATSDYEIKYSSDNITFNTVVDGVSTSTSVTLTGLSANQMYYFKVAAINSGGTGAFSSVAQKQTAPGAPSGLTATVLTSSSVSLSWTAPSGGNQAITDYQIQYSSDGGATWTTFADGTSTSTSATVTGLTDNTSYIFRVAAVNSAGTGAYSSTASATTYTSGAVTVNITKELAGATTKLTWSAAYSGTPVPTFSYTVKDGSTTIATLSGTTYYYAHPDSSSHTLQVIASNSTHWDNPSGSGSITSSASYEPNFGTDALSYNTTRTNTAMNLLVNRDQQTLWNLQCNFKTGSEVLAKSPGTWYNQTAVWVYNQTYAVSNSTSVYIECYDNANLVLNVVGFNTNRVIGGINLLNDTFDSWLGVPVAMIFVLFVAGMFSGRTAPTGILLILAMIGVMGFIGLLTISNTIWAFVLLAGTLGIFIGKRFL